MDAFLKTKKEKEEVGEEVEVEDGEGCKVNIAPFDGWGRKGSTWAIRSFCIADSNLVLSMGVAMKNITKQGCCIQKWSLLWRVLSPTYLLSETTDFGCSASMVTSLAPLVLVW